MASGTEYVGVGDWSVFLLKVLKVLSLRPFTHSPCGSSWDLNTTPLCIIE